MCLLDTRKTCAIHG